MNYLTQQGLNIVQKVKLDYFFIKMLRNKICKTLLLKHGWQKRNYLSYFKQYQEWKERLDKNDIFFKDKKILEVGAGSSIGFGYFFLKDNFKHWLSTDLYNNLKANKKLIKREGRLLIKIYNNYNKNIYNEVRVNKNNINFSEKLDFRRLEMTELANDLVNNFDIILSSAVLEHIPEHLVEKTIINLKKYLKVGGIMIHEIDLRDHINPVNPFAFYKYSPRQWSELTSDTIFYSNRLRLVDYLQIFNRLNLKVKSTDSINKSLSGKIKINEFFKKYSQEDLETVRAFIILEKL